MDPQMQAELRALTASMQALAQAQSNLSRATETQRMAQVRASAELERYTDDQVKGRKLNDKQLDLLQKTNAAKEREIKIRQEAEKAERQYQKMLATHPANSKAVTDAHEDMTSLQNKHSKAILETNKASSQLQNSFKGLIKGVDIAGLALRYFSQAIVNTVALAKDQMVANQGAIEGTDYFTAMMTQQGEAFKRGINPVEMSKMVTANRQLINAMGGTTKTMDTYQGSLLSYYTMTGSLAEANKMLLETMTSLALKGVKPTANAINDYRKDVETLSLQTGMSAEAITSLYASVSDDVDSMTLLRAARSDEREAILKNQRAIIQNSVAQGMSAQQAGEAAKMLNKMVAAKPLERIKQAAKMRAIGGALGIAGGEEAGQAMIAGKNASGEQLQQLDTFNKSITNAVDQASQKGIGYELAVSSMVDKLDMGDKYGPGSPFSTTLGDVMAKNTTELNGMYTKASNSVVGSIMEKGDQMLEQLKQIASGTIVMNAIMTGFQAMWQMINGENITSWVYDGLMESFPSFTTGIGIWIGTLVDSFSMVVNGIMGSIKTWLGELIGHIPLLGDLGDTIKKTGQAQLNEAKEQGSVFLNSIKSMLPEATSNQPRAVSPGRISSGKVTDVVDQSGTVIQAQPAALSPSGNSIASTQQMQVDPTTGIAKPITPGTPGSSKSRSIDTDSVKRAEVVADATTSTATGIQAQLKKMDDNAVYLQKLVENSDKTLDIAERQLIALTLTDNEKKNSKTTSDLRKDNKFATQYGYI